MKNKIIIIFICLFIASSFTISILNDKLEKAKKENTRLSNNQKALNDTLHVYKTKSGKNAAKTTKIAYTKKEIKDYNPELVKTIEDLKLRLKDVQSISQVSTTTKTEIKAPLDSVKCFKYSTPYLSLEGCIKNDSITATHKSVDTLTIVPNLEKKRVWLFFKKTIGVNLDVVNANPDANITYAKYIELKK